MSFTFNGVTNTTGVFTGVLAGTAYAWSITDANSCGPVTGTLNVSPAICSNWLSCNNHANSLLWRYCYRHTYRSWRHTSLVIYINGVYGIGSNSLPSIPKLAADCHWYTKLLAGTAYRSWEDTVLRVEAAPYLHLRRLTDLYWGIGRNSLCMEHNRC